MTLETWRPCCNSDLNDYICINVIILEVRRGPIFFDILNNVKMWHSFLFGNLNFIRRRQVVVNKFLTAKTKEISYTQRKEYSTSIFEKYFSSQVSFNNLYDTFIIRNDNCTVLCVLSFQFLTLSKSSNIEHVLRYILGNVCTTPPVTRIRFV